MAVYGIPILSYKVIRALRLPYKRTHLRPQPVGTAIGYNMHIVSHKLDKFFNNSKQETIYN